MKNQREIKFRAWDRVQRTMGYFELLDATTIMAGRMEDLEIQQFTGLKDKNGKEIYEGDILQHIQYQKNKTLKYGERIYAVRGIKKIVEWNDYQHNNTKRYVGYGISSPVKNFEVIGNIMANPELLNK